MAKETDIQGQIKKSVRLDGGYCHKLTNAFTIGIPDLLTALPPFAPCILEVKTFGVVKPNFDRQIDVTPKQEYELETITAVYERLSTTVNLGQGYTKDGPPPVFSGILVHCVMAGQHYLTGLPYHAERHTYALLLDQQRTGKREVHEYWNLRPLLEAIGVTKI